MHFSRHTWQVWHNPSYNGMLHYKSGVGLLLFWGSEKRTYGTERTFVSSTFPCCALTQSSFHTMSTVLLTHSKFLIVDLQHYHPPSSQTSYFLSLLALFFGLAARSACSLNRCESIILWKATVVRKVLRLERRFFCVQAAKEIPGAFKVTTSIYPLYMLLFMEHLRLHCVTERYVPFCAVTVNIPCHVHAFVSLFLSFTLPMPYRRYITHRMEASQIVAYCTVH